MQRAESYGAQGKIRADAQQPEKERHALGNQLEHKVLGKERVREEAAG